MSSTRRPTRQKDQVEQRSFADWLKDVEPEAKSPAASLRALRTCGRASPSSWPRPSRWWWIPWPSIGGRTAGCGSPRCRDYPSGMDGNGKAGGVIKCLEDTDGDGHYDRAPIFLTDVPFPTGESVAQGSDHHGGPRHHLCRGYRRRWPGRRARSLVSRLWRREPAAPRQRAHRSASTIGCIAPMATVVGRSNRRRPATRCRSASAIFAFSPTTDASTCCWGSRNSRACAMMPATGSARRIASRCTSSCSKIVTCAATGTMAAPNGRVDVSIAPARRRCSHRAAPCRASTILTW